MDTRSGTERVAAQRYVTTVSGIPAEFVEPTRTTWAREAVARAQRVVDGTQTGKYTKITMARDIIRLGQHIERLVRLAARCELYETTLRVIADGHWNAGRDAEIPLREYAEATLRIKPWEPL